MLKKFNLLYKKIKKINIKLAPKYQKCNSIAKNNTISSFK